MDLHRTTGMSRGLLYAGLVSYAVAPPVVHWGHERIVAGFESLGLRVGLPLATSFLAFAVGPKCSNDAEGDHEDFSCLPFVMGGLIAGTVAAVVIDSAVLAKEKVTPNVEASPRFDVAPMVTGDRRGAVVRVTF
jgi:hypothetical protein